MMMGTRLNLLVFRKGQNATFWIETGQTKGLLRQEWKGVYDAFVVDGRAPAHWYDIVFGSSNDLG